MTELRDLLKIAGTAFYCTTTPDGNYQLSFKSRFIRRLTSPMSSKKEASRELSKTIINDYNFDVSNINANDPKDLLFKYLVSRKISLNFYEEETPSKKFIATVSGEFLDKEDTFSVEAKTDQEAASLALEVLRNVKFLELIQTMVAKDSRSDVTRMRNDNIFTDTPPAVATGGAEHLPETPSVSYHGNTPSADDYARVLRKFCQNEPAITIADIQGRKVAELKMKYVFYDKSVPLQELATKKQVQDAQKKVAQFALKVVFSDDCGDLDKVKGNLQSHCQKIANSNIPVYDIEGTKDIGRATVAFEFKIIGEIGDDENDAKDHAYKTLFEVLSKVDPQIKVESQLLVSQIDIVDDDIKCTPENGNYICEALICHEFTPKPEKGFPSKKDAEKYAASFALEAIYGENCSDNTVKNKLQEKAVQERKGSNPVYDSPKKGDQFVSSVQLQFRVKGAPANNEESAKQNLYQAALQKVQFEK